MTLNLRLMSNSEGQSEPDAIESNVLPGHLAIIMDGNGRWAKIRGWRRGAGHLRGIRAVRRIVAEARETGIPYLTLFTFSTENWQRNTDEVTFLLRLFERYLRREADKLAAEGICVRAIGHRQRLPTELIHAIQLVEARTAFGSKMQLTLAISYGGQDEIVAAAQKLAHSFASSGRSSLGIDRYEFARHLWFPEMPPVDLLIRTGGERRLSNFMLWQLAYAELMFVATLWPDFSARDLRICLAQFGRRQRRFGKEN